MKVIKPKINFLILFKLFENIFTKVAEIEFDGRQIEFKYID